ncbi:hypothetical protein Sjap_000566 [Stephania japonica]|uniref:SRP54-type proteins GTP-binding domain-containing protein n=1 Tax=Stephania japonica TaxID=461633 RepID=A0AAP0PU59_9MAGN
MHRAGAYEQLKLNATKAKIEFYEIDTTDSVTTITGVKELNKNDMIIIDTSGFALSEVSKTHDALEPHLIVLVMDVTSLSDQLVAFQQGLSVGAVILSNMDGRFKGGAALNAAAAGIPITFFGNGQHVEDLKLYDPTKYVIRLLGKLLNL